MGVYPYSARPNIEAGFAAEAFVEFAPQGSPAYYDGPNRKGRRTSIRLVV